MDNLVTIACVGRNMELGANNDLIWKFREDLQTFKEITMGHPMVMGLNTWKSLPFMLPGRKHLVISDQPFETPEGVEVFGSIDAFVEYAKKSDQQIFVIGGGMIYRQLLPFCNRMILTEVEATDPDAQIFFPTFDANEWTTEKVDDFTDPVSLIAYKRKFYKRK